MLSLRRCIQRNNSARRNSTVLYRQWSTLSSSTFNNDEDTNIPKTSKVTATSYTNNTTKRHFSISRHPDPLQQHGTINKLDDPDDDVVPLTPIDGLGGNKSLYTADDLDTYEEQDGTNIGSSKDSSDTSPLSEFWNDELEEAGLNAAGNKGGSDDYANLFGGAFGSSSSNNNNDDELDEQTKADKAYTIKQLAIQEELDKRTGRLWTDEWIITDEEWMTDELYDDIEEWQVNKFVTRKALESVIVYTPSTNTTTTSSVNGVPNLLDLSKLSVPKSLPSHPGHGTPIKYANYRKKQITKKLQTSIQLAIHDDLIKILSMDSYDEKQVAVDALYEGIVDTMSKRERVLSKLPNFHILVEEGLEKVLVMVQGSLMKDGKKNKVEEVAAAEKEDEEIDLLAVDSEKEEDAPVTGAASVKADKEGTNVEDIIDVMGVNNNDTPTPIFMDILAAANSLKLPTTASSDATSGDDNEESDKEEDNQQTTLSEFFTESNKDDVPNLLYPLNVHKAEGVGRMVEEWQLAANKETKRIMIRDVMVDIASKIVDAANCCASGDEGEKKGAARVFVSGKRGVGKTAALAGIVASARISGHIVVYHPDGDRLRKHGYYIDPCNHRKGIYNLPEIAKEFCQELLTSHGEDVASLPAVSRDGMKEYLTDDQIRRVFKRAYADDESVTEEDTTKMTELSLDKVLTVGIGSSSLSSGCYCTVIDQLMNQTEKPFTVVMDEFNCYYDHGHYFHMEYDEHVRMGVPPNRISIFKPFMDAMGLYPEESGVDITDKYATDSKKAVMKWGSIVVGTSESRAVKQSFTQSLEECAQKAQPLREGEDGVHAVEVRRFDNTEVQHQLYNYEIIGIGKLRFDRGETSLNPEEVEYLRLVSGGSGQHLMNACMIPSS